MAKAVGFSEKDARRVASAVRKVERRNYGKNALRKRHHTSSRRTRFSGIVWVGGNRFYDPDIFTDPADQVGAAITYSSTDNKKEFIKIKTTGKCVTDVGNTTVEYVDGPAPSNFDKGEYVFMLAYIVGTINVNYLMTTGAGNNEYYGINESGEVGFYDPIPELPSGAKKDWALVATVDGATDIRTQLTWKPLSDFTMPVGSEGDLLQCTGGSNWEAITGAKGDFLMSEGEGTGFVSLPVPSGPALMKYSPESNPEWWEPDASNQALIVFDAEGEQPFNVLEPSATHPCILVSQTNGTIELLEITSRFMTAWRDENDEAVADYGRAF
jgi:hypothetical protein